MDQRKEVVLVTGGSGLIGRAVAKALAPRFQVVSLDVKQPRTKLSDETFLAMDVSSQRSIRQALSQVRRRYESRIASVVHLAAYYSFSGEDSPKYGEITIRGTERLLDELQSFEVEQFLFSSTMLVHAPCEPGQKITESWPIEPKWPYPKSKVEAERIIEAKHGKIPFVLMRIAGVYDDRCHSIPIAHQIERIHERHLTSHFYPGQLDRGQSFVHLDDLVEAISLAVRKRKELPEGLALLIGEPETLSYGELQDEIGRLIHGEEWTTLRIPKPAAKAGAWVQEKAPVGEEPFIRPWMIDLASDHYELDISRAQELLAWSPEHRLRMTLPRMIEELKKDPKSWYRANKLSEPIPIAVTARKYLPHALGALSVIGGAALLLRRRRLRATRPVEPWRSRRAA